MANHLPLDAGAIARYVSPDGQLVWRVEVSKSTSGEPVYAAGFEGTFWHVHPDQLRRRGEPIEVLLTLTEELLADKLVIIEERWPVPDNPEELGLERSLLVDLDFELSVKPNETAWKLRFWSGKVVDVEDLIDGAVAFTPLDQKFFADDQ